MHKILGGVEGTGQLQFSDASWDTMVADLVTKRDAFGLDSPSTTINPDKWKRWYELLMMSGMGVN